jgi:tetratricopeptide (TPR) repeat protein
MPLRLRTAFVVLALVGCVTTPPVHPRALENAELCAQSLQADDLIRAEVYCDLGLQFSPQFADLWVNKGLIALKKGNNGQAKEHFIRALRHNQEAAQAYLNLGVIYFVEGANGKAHDNFQRALKVNPDYLEARYNLGLVFVRLEQYDKAKKEFRTLLALHPQLADAHRELGVIAGVTGNFDEAVEHLKRAVELDPNHGAAWYDLGSAYSELSRFCESTDAFKECVRVDERDAQCLNALSINVRKCHLVDPALREVRDTRSAEQTPRAQYELGLEYRQRGMRREETQAFRRCTQLDGKAAQCHYALHEIFLSEEKHRDARVACKNVVKFASPEELPQQIETCERYLSRNTF